VCPPYLPANTRLQTYEFWSSDMLKLFREAGMPRRVPPALPACAADDSSDSPRIASPLRGVTYTLRRTGEGSIALEAGAAGDVREMFWFDGAALIGKVPVAAGALPWRPSVDGAHLIRVIDDHGRTAERDVAIQFNN